MNVYEVLHTDRKVSRIAYDCMGNGGRCEQMAASRLADVVGIRREKWYQLFEAARGGPLP